MMYEGYACWVPSERLILRRARREELDTLVTIDDAASTIYAEAGLVVALAHDHPFVLAERERWGKAIEASSAYVAVDEVDEKLLGFVTLAEVDGAPYLDQISVLPSAMRRGIGSALMHRAIEAAYGLGSLWLTTYAHLPWNAPYYERFGFARIPEAMCGPSLRGILEAQREVLPDPRERVAMVRR